MNNYPSFPQMEGSKLVGLSDTQIDRAVGGNPRLRSFYDTTKYTIHLIHWLTPAQLVTLMAYYETAANKTGLNIVPWNATGATYNAYFTARPDETWQNGIYVVTVDLVQG